VYTHLLYNINILFIRFYGYKMITRGCRTCTLLVYVNMTNISKYVWILSFFVQEFGPKPPATGLRFAPSEVILSLGRQNLDHNSTWWPILSHMAPPRRRLLIHIDIEVDGQHYTGTLLTVNSCIKFRLWLASGQVSRRSQGTLLPSSGEPKVSNPCNKCVTQNLI
jgi:hypothetical protein